MAYSKVAGMQHSIINIWVLTMWWSVLSGKEKFPIKFSHVTGLLPIAVATTPLRFSRISWACKQFFELISRWRAVLCLTQPSPVAMVMQSQLPFYCFFPYAVWSVEWDLVRSLLDKTGSGISIQMCYLTFLFGLVNGQWPFMPTHMFTSCRTV